MKKLLLILLVLAAFTAKSQTTITASYVTGTVTFSTGITYITFVVRNNNPYPVTITNMTTLMANLYEKNIFTLWYSATSLSGAPGISAPAWTPIATSPSPISIPFMGQVTPFDCIGFVIPANTTYRFALEGAKGTCVRGGVTPNTFSAGGVDLLVGNATIPPSAAQVGYFTWYALGSSAAAYYFDGSITFAPANAFTDLQVKSIVKPTSICSSTSSTLGAQLCNKSPHTLNFANNNATINFNVSGPIAHTNSVTLTTGTLAPCACVNASISGVNMSASGTYSITATASMAGVTDNDLTNNTATDAITNYKPLVTPTVDSVCQNTNGSLFAGFDAMNCQPRTTSVTTNISIVTAAPVDGTSDATAGYFGQATLPTLPTGAIITGANLYINNLNGNAANSNADQARFNIYPTGGSPAAPLVAGASGCAISFSVYNFEYSLNLTVSQINGMYGALGAGGSFSVGYWEQISDIPGSDIALNAQGLPTIAQLTIYYTIPQTVRWFAVPTGGIHFSSGTPMNPFITPGSGLSSTAFTGSTNFYAACMADEACRVPVQLKIKSSPAVAEDSIKTCELVSGTGNGSFDLTTLISSVSLANPLATVEFYTDPSLSNQIINPSNYVSNSGYAFSKVILLGQCHSSDTIHLTVHPKPDFFSSLVSQFICEPNVVDASNLISSFSSIPLGTDTLFFEDAAYSIAHPNPHTVAVSDTVYMLLSTNTIPACKDSSVAQINILALNPNIVNQASANYSIPGVVGCESFNLVDNNTDTLFSGGDCSRIAAIMDLPNGISLGSTSICEEIESGVPVHNGQPYVNRNYKITPTVNDSAIICLYYLENDLIDYNNAALLGGWPMLPTSFSLADTVNLCFSQVDNGNISTPGHTATVIPHNKITSSYDASTTVWSFCFKVDSFSTFYLHSQNPFNIPLSVSLSKFMGRKEGNTSKLSWTTLNEKENSHFIVQRSADAKLFTSVSNSIPSKAMNGNSQVELNYDYTDVKPLNGHNYYRLQQVDIDGKLNNSNVIDIYYQDETTIMLYPNPVQDVVNLDVESLTASSATITINDATGRVVKTIVMPLQSGANKTQIDLQDLTSGVYLLTMTNSKGLRYTETIRKK